MARFPCVCGYIIRTSGAISNPDELRVYRDDAFDPFFERGETAPVADVYGAATLAYRCPESGHVWIFWDGFDREAILYTPTEDPHHRSMPRETRDGSGS
jgi:hypothetical protein